MNEGLENSQLFQKVVENYWNELEAIEMVYQMLGLSKLQQEEKKDE